MPPILDQRNAPDAIRSLSTMSRPDYVDCFTVTTAGVGKRSPEEWARTALDHVAGIRGQFAWRGVLRLRLEHTAENIAGWAIADRGDDWIRLEATSPFMTAHIVVHVGDDRVTVAVFVRYDKPLAHLVWPIASVIHRRAVPGLLRGTVKHLASHG